MQRLEVSGAVRLIYRSLGVKRLTAWSRILFEQLTGPQLVKKLPERYGTRKFTTIFTRALHLSGPNPRLCNLVTKHVRLSWRVAVNNSPNPQAEGPPITTVTKK